MKKNIVTKLFNYLYKKNILSLFIAAFGVFGLVSLLYFRTSIQSNIDYRLERKLDYISSSITGKLNNYAITLSYVDAYFRTEGFPDTKKFKTFIQNIESERINHGIQGVGFMALNKGHKISAPIALVEPLKWPPAQRIGSDMMADSIGEEAILRAIYSTNITLSKPKISLASGELGEQTTVIMLLPYYDTNLPLASNEDRLNAIKGLIYIPIRMNDFFETNLGKPRLDNETVNITFESIDAVSKKSTVAYQRFDLAPKYKYREKTKIIDLYGQRWKLGISTFPSFFTFKDKYVVNILGGLFLLFIVLSIGIFYQTHNLFDQEKKTKIVMEDSTKVKVAFLQNMSHEIRTPLNAISGFSEMLAHTTNEAEKKYLVESIRKNSSELTAFVDNILDISKIEFGRIFINKKNICLMSTVEKIKDTMGKRAHAKGLLFEIESVSKLPTGIQVDESRVNQILVNLIGNAIKFTESGYVKLQIEAQVAANGQTQMIFTIIDTGIGISTPDQLELFQSFSQADFSNTRRYGGIGLGLALSQRLAQQFDGDVILLKSQLGKGSTFRLRIPCGELHQVEWKENLFASLINPSIQLGFLSDSTLNNKKILIVEDSEENQQIFKYFLESAGAVCDTAENGAIAIEKASCFDYDVILMDIQMPVMDGLVATKKICAMGYQKPIIALTAHASVEAKLSCLRAGCIELITKPVTQESLIQKILIILEEQKNVVKDSNS